MDWWCVDGRSCSSGCFVSARVLCVLDADVPPPEYLDSPQMTDKQLVLSVLKIKEQCTAGGAQGVKQHVFLGIPGIPL